MKIATNQYFLKLGRHLADQQADIATLQAKLATGDTMVTPGSEPRIAARSLELNSIIEKQQGFLDNLSRLDGRLMQEESVVTTMRTLVTRMQELTIRLLQEGAAPSGLIGKAQRNFPTAAAAVFLIDDNGRPHFDGLFFPDR